MIKDGSMTDGTKVWQMNWSASNSSSMKWKVIRLYNGYYLFRPLNSSTLAMSAYTTNVTVKNIGTSNFAANVPTLSLIHILGKSTIRINDMLCSK